MVMQFTNNAVTTLASGITNVATSLSVAAGAGALFPAAGAGNYFYCTLANNSGSFEIVKVTARATDTFTIVRGQDGTSGTAWLTGDKCELRLVAASLNDIPKLDEANVFTQPQSLTAGSSALHAVNVTQWQGQVGLAFQTTGTLTAYVLTPVPAITAYTAGISFYITFNVACGAAPTIAISGIATPPNLVKQQPDGTYANCEAGDIPINHRSRVTLLSATQVLVEKLPSVAVLGDKIINGPMWIDQRNKGTAVTPTVTGTYLVDRFFAGLTQASKLTFQQVLDAPPGYTYSTKITVAAQYSPISTDIFLFGQRVMGSNIADMQFGLATAQQVTADLWVKGSVAGTYSISLRNSATSRSYIGTITVAAGWVRQLVTLTADTTGTWLTDNTIGVTLALSLGSGSTFQGTAGSWQAANVTATAGSVQFVNQTAGSTLNITGVRFFLGNSSAVQPMRMIEADTSLAYAYYFRFTPTVSSGLFGVAASVNTSLTNVYVNFPVSMRIAPTALGQSGTAADYAVNFIGITTACTSVPTFGSATQYMAQAVFTTGATLTAGQAGKGITNGATNGYLEFTAEL